MRLDLISKAYPTREVLGALSLKVARGERLAVLGPSGIGKSTLLRILAGLDRDYRGTLGGETRRAVVFQEPVLLPWRDALANITIPTGCDGATAQDWLAQVGLAGQGAKFPRQFSLGQQRRLALARAFAAAAPGWCWSRTARTRPAPCAPPNGACRASPRSFRRTDPRRGPRCPAHGP